MLMKILEKYEDIKMQKFFFVISKDFRNGSEIHYNIENLDEFANYYEERKKVVKEERKANKNPRYKEKVLINNLKIISQQIINRLGVKFDITKQVDDDEYLAGCGVRNIKTIEFPYIKVIDINSITNKQAEVIETREDFNKFSRIAEAMIEANYGKVPNSLAATVRKRIIEAYEADEDFRRVQWQCRITGEEFKNFKMYFHGGICLVNKNYENKTMNDIHYADMTSAYIAQMIFQKFPVSRPINVPTKNLTDAEVKEIFENKYFLACLKLYGVKLKNAGINPLKIDEGEDIVYITNFDWRILKETIEYDSLQIGELWLFHLLSKMPEKVKSIMTDLIADKARIKAKKDTAEFDEGKYEVAKVKLNCTFGIFGSGIDLKYCNIFWAIFITAYQRLTLWNRISENGIENLIYADTDSIFSLKPVDVPKGNALGEWSVYKYKRMTVRGNKGYIVEEYNDKLHLTLAGATKSGVFRYIRENGITNDKLFEDGFFKNLEIPAEYEVCYRYIATPEEVYKKCYPLKLNKADTIINILIDKYNLEKVL